MSAKYVTAIEIYTTPEPDWTLVLDGTDIGGLQFDVSKAFFEQALACKFGANHHVTYVDKSLLSKLDNAEKENTENAK